MEQTVEEKIQAAIQPLLDRIAALETQQQLFQQEIASLQTVHASKIPQKPAVKPTTDPRERIHTAKDVKRPNEHHEVKPQSKPSVRPGPKKQEVKVEGEEGSKVGAKTPSTGNKVAPSPNLNKDNNDGKNVKGRPSTAAGTKPTTSVAQNKSGIHDKKPIGNKANEPEHEKKEEGEDKKSHQSKEKDHKGSAQGLKSPGPAKKPVDKKPVVPSPAPVPKKPVGRAEPKPIHGGKSVKHPAPTKQKILDELKPEESPTTQKDEPIPDEIKEQNIALNNPYTPNEGEQSHEVVQTKVESPQPPAAEPQEALQAQPVHEQNGVQQPAEKVEENVVVEKATQQSAEVAATQGEEETF